MGYANFKATDTYVSRLPGAGTEVLLISRKTGRSWLGQVIGCTWSDNNERVPTREAGSPHPNEIVDGFTEPSCSLEAYFSPEWNDNVIPNTNHFIDEHFDIIQRIATGYPGEGNVLDAGLDFAPAQDSITQGNSDVLRFSMSGPMQERLSGQQWADRFGQN